MDYKAQLDELQKKLEAKRIEKAKLEERKLQLEEESKKLLGELHDLGLQSIEEVEAEMKKIETEIVEGLQKCSDILK